MLTSTQQWTWRNQHPVMLLQSKVVHYRNFEMKCRHAFQIWRITDSDMKESFTNVEIILISVTIFHATCVGLRYLLVCTCFSFFISIELVTKRSHYICVSIWLIFQLIDLESLLMSISRWTVVILDIMYLLQDFFVCKQDFVQLKDTCGKWFISSGLDELNQNYFVSYKKIKGSSFL